MKKTLLVLGMICGLGLGQATCVFAGAYEWGGLGPRAGGMGGAFIGVADDWTASYWNPAGLTQTEGIGVGIELLQPNIKLTDGNSISNLDQANISIDQGDIFLRVYPVEPTSFEKTEISGSFYQPGVGGFFEFKGIKIGAGFYIPVGNWVDFEDTITDQTNAEIIASYFTSMWLMVGNASVAKEIITNLSLGAGLNVLYLNSEFEAQKSYKATNPLFIDYNFNYIAEGSGIGFEGVFGVMYKPLSELSVGGVYRTGSKISLDGSGEYSHTLAPPDETSDLTQKFHHPATYGIGLAYKPMPKLIIAVDWQGTNWSTWKTVVDFKIDGLVLKDKDIDWNWKVSNRYRIGGEFKVMEELSLRAGFGYDESPAPDKQISFTNIPDANKQFLTLGIGYKLKGWQIDGLYENIWGNRKVNDIKYSLRTNAFTLALSRQY